MEGFKGVSEKFHVSLLSDEGQGSERVVVQIGLDGLFVLSPDGGRVQRKYPLNHISRWALRGSTLVLYTKTPVDVEERTVSLQADDRTIRSALDTLTSCCMQLVEILQSKENTTENTQTTNSLTSLLNGGSSRKASLPAAEDVEFWKNPEKTGWLQSQGDHIKTWRRRWFVLKQGYMFRFANENVNSSSKPRGLVDLSKVTDVSAARDATGRNNSLMLSTPTGRVLYVADSETEQVEWLSALEGSVAKIVKLIAGVEDEPAPAPAPVKSSSQNQWAQQLEKSYGAASQGGSRTSSIATDRNTMVKIVGYNQDTPAPAARMPSSSYDAPDYGTTGSSFGYDNIAGIAGIRNTPSTTHKPSSSSSFTDSFVKVDYPSYPVLTPTSGHQSQTAQAHQPAPYTAPTSTSYGQYGAQQQQQQPAYSGNQYAAHLQQAASADQYGSQQAAYSSGGGHYFYQPEAAQTPAQQSHQQQGYGQSTGTGQHAAASGYALWQQLQTENGQPYYYNASTGVTQWEQPAGFV